MQIDFLGEKVELSDAKLNFISIRKVLCEREKEASRKFWDIHSDFNTLEGMIEGVNSVVLSEINKAMQDVIGFLQNEGVYDFNDSLFWEKYVYPMGVTDPWEEAIDDLVDKCQRIDGQNQAAHQYREQRKQSRGRWIGGGYGVQGAIKGSMQAGVMNMGTGAAHSMINGIGNAISNGIANSEKRLIMNDFKTTCELALGLEKTMQEMVYAAGKALEDCGIPVEYPTEEDKKRAEAIIDSIRKQIVPADKRIEQIIRAWNYDPFNSTLYSTILDAGLGKMQDIADRKSVV